MPNTQTELALSRRRKIDKMLRGAGINNQTELAQEFGVDVRTILNDLNWLEICAGKIETNGRNKKYADKNCPAPFDLDENKSLAILLAFTALKQYCGSFFSNEISSFFKEEITKKIDGDMAKKFMSNENIIIFNTPHNFIEKTLPIEYNQIIYDLFLARINQQKIRISYSKPRDDDYEERIIQPYFFVNEEGEWNVWGFCENRQKVRQFKVARIENTERIDETYEIPKEYKSREYFDDCFDNFDDGVMRNFVIQFDEFATPHIDTRLHHKSQKIKALDDGGCEISFKCYGLYAVAKWVYKYMSHAKVIEPPELVEIVKTEAEKMLKNYTTTL